MGDLVPFVLKVHDPFPRFLGIPIVVEHLLEGVGSSQGVLRRLFEMIEELLLTGDQPKHGPSPGIPRTTM
jgi:hypothetical protein